MMKTSIHTVICVVIISMVATMLPACDEEMPVQEARSLLDIQASIQGVEYSRTVIESSTFPPNSNIGVTLTDRSGVTYDQNRYHNKPYTTTDGSRFTSEDGVLLSNTKGTLYAYYPYNPDVTDITQIPIESGETDYLVSEPFADVYVPQTEADLSFKHIMSRINIKLRRKNYVGTGKVSSLSIKSNAIALKGSLNMMDGKITTESNEENHVCEWSDNYNIDNETEKSFLVIPTGQTDNLILSVILDGEVYYTTIPLVTMEAGKQYTIISNI